MTGEVEGKEFVVDGEILLGEDDEDDAFELLTKDRGSEKEESVSTSRG